MKRNRKPDSLETKLKRTESRIAYGKAMFFKKAKEVHGDRYDYSLVEYKGGGTPVKIICKEHGEFFQKPTNHTSGKNGCQLCGREVVKKAIYKNKVFSTEVFKKIEIEKNIEFVDLEGEYKNGKSILSYRCKFHPKYIQTKIATFLRKMQIPCGICSPNWRLTPERLESVLQEKYYGKYSLLSRTDAHTAKFSCPEHGEFSQDIDTFLQKYPGCPSCIAGRSMGEKELVSFVRYIYKKEIRVKDRKLLRKHNKEIDIFLPEDKIAIEYNGVFWHSFPRKPKYYHRDKRRMCEKEGVRLIHIWEDEWRDSRERIKEYLKGVLSPVGRVKVYARECEIAEIPFRVAKDFLTKHHLQGYGTRCQTYYCLLWKQELVAVMSFRRGYIKGKVELQRFCVASQYSVLGGFSRLLNNYLRNNKGSQIVSYVDLDKFSGGAYFKYGFKTKRESYPLSYVRNGKRLSRHLFKKKRLIEKGFKVGELTEIEFCVSKKAYPIWGSGILTLHL